MVARIKGVAQMWAGQLTEVSSKSPLDRGFASRSTSIAAVTEKSERRKQENGMVLITPDTVTGLWEIPVGAAEEKRKVSQTGLVRRASMRDTTSGPLEILVRHNVLREGEVGNLVG